MSSERVSLLGGDIAVEGVTRNHSEREHEHASGVESARKAWKTHRRRVWGVTLGMLAIVFGLLALTASSPGARGGLATRDSSVNDAFDVDALASKLGLSSDKGSVGETKEAAKSARNSPGRIPGLAAHVESKTHATKFRMITFCNKSYWMFAHALLESMKAVAPSMVDFWTIIVPDEETKAYIESETRASGKIVDVFVDEDLKTQVVKYKSAGKLELKNMLSWRRVHAMHTLLDKDFTTMFIEPDAVMQKNPLKAIHDMLTSNDVAMSADYGLGSSARPHANSKVMIAKPSAQGKKLFDVWQRAEASYSGPKAEIGFFISQVLPHLDVLTAKIKVLDQTVVGNYLTHHEKAGQLIITGTGCDDVNYKINFISQVLRHAQPTDQELEAFDYEGIAQGCDHAGREKVFKISNEYAKKVLAKMGRKKSSKKSLEK
jgi:hypothetical protein